MDIQTFFVFIYKRLNSKKDLNFKKENKNEQEKIESEERAKKRPRQKGGQGKKIEHLLQELHLKVDDIYEMLEWEKREEKKEHHFENEHKQQSEYHRFISKNFHRKEHEGMSAKAIISKLATEWKESHKHQIE